MVEFDDGVDNYKNIPINYILSPGEYALLTEDSAATAAAYTSRNSTVFIEMDLPTFNNDSATCVESRQFDRCFSYDKDMHFELINDAEGVF